MRLGRWLGRVALGLAIATPALSSCAFGLPRATCDATTVSALMSGSDIDPTCVACLEDQCCDEVGFCVEDKETHCAEHVKDTHACVLQAGLRGALEERTCKARLGDGRHADALYSCMRGHCGADCRLPICQLDPAALQFGSASCDRCVTSSCCGEVNACYQHRTCKLALECIVKNCEADLANDFANAARLDVAALEQQACGAPRDGSPGPLNVISSCIRTCVEDYAFDPTDPNDDGTQSSGCLAFKVFACGARAACGAECVARADVDVDADADADGTERARDGADADGARDASDAADE